MRKRHSEFIAKQSRSSIFAVAKRTMPFIYCQDPASFTYLFCTSASLLYLTSCNSREMTDEESSLATVNLSKYIRDEILRSGIAKLVFGEEHRMKEACLKNTLRAMMKSFDADGSDDVNEFETWGDNELLNYNALCPYLVCGRSIASTIAAFLALEHTNRH
ncbi:unnamed protein product [Cylindrotheca closterium]|uniref:Uncharacterized protein n=1 Tax=Cylindrotheca closterium TaxID=2856 RepID=A0AAD2CQ53_9STRA|nr:unnamed protein product [Cylindrotheca closterium]